MANITELLQKILNARYGKDVRGSIHDAIQAMNQEIEDDRPTVINSMERAETAAETAEKSASDSERSKETADGSAKMAKSYTHGGTGLRENEDTDNAKYYKEQVENKALLIEGYSQTASDAAQTATGAANRAEQSVSSIGTSVEDAQAAATSAIESASSASNDAQNALKCASAALESAESSSQSASEAQASAEAAARSAEEAKAAAGGDFVTHQEVGQPNGVAGLDENGKVPTDQLPEDIGGGIPTSEKGQPNGVATLGENGKVPTDQLPEIGEKVVVDGTTIVKDEKTGVISLADDITKSFSDTQKSLSDHTGALVMSAEGVHGFRYHEDKLEAQDKDGEWHEISTGGGGGSGIDGGTAIPINDVQLWLKCAEITDKPYSTISEVLSDIDTLYLLMSSENAMKYMTRSIGFASDVCANENAMTYIGSSAYCDSILLENDNGEWISAISQSEYMGKIFVSMIPAMTSNTEPRGVVSTNTTIIEGNDKAYISFSKGNGIGAQYKTNVVNQIVTSYSFDSPQKISLVSFGILSWSSNKNVKVTIKLDGKIVYSEILTFGTESVNVLDIKTSTPFNSYSKIEYIVDCLETYTYNAVYQNMNGQSVAGVGTTIYGVFGRP